jgi:hypothetical protein
MKVYQAVEVVNRVIHLTHSWWYASAGNLAFKTRCGMSNQDYYLITIGPVNPNGSQDPACDYCAYCYDPDAVPMKPLRFLAPSQRRPKPKAMRKPKDVA